MRFIRREVKQSLSKREGNRKAAFIQIESTDTKKFKYHIGFKVSKYLKDKLVVLQTLFNKIIQTPQLWLHKIDFIEIRNQLSLWLSEALIEGFIVNFTVWALLGWEFNWITMLAWGFAVKQSLGIYWRLKKDGPTHTIPKKNERFSES